MEAKSLNFEKLRLVEKISDAIGGRFLGIYWTIGCSRWNFGENFGPEIIEFNAEERW